MNHPEFRVRLQPFDFKIEHFARRLVVKDSLFFRESSK